MTAIYLLIAGAIVGLLFAILVVAADLLATAKAILDNLIVSRKLSEQTSRSVREILDATESTVKNP